MARRIVLSALLLGAVPLAGCASTVREMRQYSHETDAERVQRRAGALPVEQEVRNRKRARRDRRAAVNEVAALPMLNGAPAAGRIYRGSLPAPTVTAPQAAAASAPGETVPAGMQYLYASGEAAAASLQAYLALSDWILGKTTARQIGQPIASAVLSPGASPAAPRYLPCGDKPLAVVLDIDETSLLNLGYEDSVREREGYDAARWDAWERTGASAVAAVPGALEAKAVAGAVGVTFVFNSNRAAANAAQTVAALDGAGLGPAVHGDTLWLQGDAGGGSGKDARRAAIAKKYCVIALVGDQLGDFSDAFNVAGTTPASRRALASGKALKTVWGHGWFILPNPVYGTALKGGRDDIFPADKRWTYETQGAK